MSKALIIGYGNIDREDDGLAWHVLRKLSIRLGLASPEDDQEELSFITGEKVDLLFVLQLTPELGEQVAGYDRVCFVDAHTGNVSAEIQFGEIRPEYQKSPLTHHMTPQTVLAISGALYGKQPAGYLLSIRGYEFGFSQSLSQRTSELADQGVEQIIGWLGA